MSKHSLHFSPASDQEEASYKLLELTPELHDQIEKAIKGDEDLRLTIKGQANQEAVLCTVDKTYGMRSIGLSNSFLVVTAVPDARASSFDEDVVVVRDQLHELIELTPVVPRLHKLMMLVRGRVYDESQEDDMYVEDTSVKPFTYADAKREIQASEVELDKGLKENRILVIDDELRPISKSYLHQILELMLNVLVSLSMKYTSASIEELCSTLADDHNVPRNVSTQVMAWFGEIMDGRWVMDTTAVVKEMGLGILRDHMHEAIAKHDLLQQWKTVVGDTFQELVTLDLLLGNYIEVDSASNKVKYFPASTLPVEPAARFAELFLTRPKWKGDEISPFLSDIAVNTKERDKLMLKYCRTVNEGQGIRYTARAQYNS